MDPSLICGNGTDKNVGKSRPNFRGCIDVNFEHKDHFFLVTICILTVTKYYDKVFENLDISHAHVNTFELKLVIYRTKRIIVEVDKPHLLLSVDSGQLTRNY